MRAAGLFFLRMAATIGCDPTGARVGVLLPVAERDPADHKVVLNTLTAKWKGEDALAFFDANQAELRAGRALELELDRLRGHDGEWWASVTRCVLAPLPPSWKAKAEAGNDRSAASA